jgi:hypothetical protein
MSWVLAILLSEQITLKSKAFDFAQDVIKQLITLATAIIALTVTFIHDLAASASPHAVRFVEAAWVTYIVSICCGIAALLQLAGHLEKAEMPSIYSSGIKWASLLQVVAFIVVTGLTVAFGFSIHQIVPTLSK